MDGVEKIKTKIIKDAEREASGYLKEAKKEVTEIKKEANTEINEKTAKIKENAKKKAEQEKQRVLSSANLKMHNFELEMQEKLLQETFEKAKKDIVNLKKNERYEKALQKIIEDSLKEIDKKNVNLILSKKDKNIGEKIAEKMKLKISEFREDIEGGVIIEKKDGSVRIDNSLEQIFNRKKDNLRGEIAGILFRQSK